MRVIICGGVSAPEEEIGDIGWLIDALDDLHRKRRITTVALRAGNDAVPLDLHADIWAEKRAIDRVAFPENGQRGAFADHDRNRLMLTMLRPEMVVILPGGPDTTNLAHQARGMKIKVVEITPSPEPERGQDATPEQRGAGDQGGEAPPPTGRGRPGAPRPARTGAKTDP